jgi:hypothetical protein
MDCRSGMDMRICRIVWIWIESIFYRFFVSFVFLFCFCVSSTIGAFIIYLRRLFFFLGDAPVFGGYKTKKGLIAFR